MENQNKTENQSKSILFLKEVQERNGDYAFTKEFAKDSKHHYAFVVNNLVKMGLLQEHENRDSKSYTITEKGFEAIKESDTL